MKKKLLNGVAAATFFLSPLSNFAQTAPALGTAANFVLFTKTGSFTNDGASVVTGDVGTNIGVYNAFPPGILVGQAHVGDEASATAITDMSVAYNDLIIQTCQVTLEGMLGNDQVLGPAVYCQGAASALNGTLTLDGQGNPNSIFIFKINGALATAGSSKVVLINLAQACNVYWQVNGAVSLGESSVFAGTFICAGPIDMYEGSLLEGRGLSKQGAINMHAAVPFVPVCCAGPTITCPPDINIEAEADEIILDNIDLGLTVSGGCGTTLVSNDAPLTFPIGTTLITWTARDAAENASTCSQWVTLARCECVPPVNFTVDSISPVSALLCWDSSRCAKTYIVGWRKQGSNTWINDVVSAPTHCTTFTNNYPAVYEIQVSTACVGGDTSVYSSTFTFETYPSCLPPTHVYTDNIEDTKATGNWTPATDANKQNFWYRRVGNAAWITKNLSATKTSYQMKDLMPQTSYEWEIRSSCKDEVRKSKGAFTPLQTFTTLATRLSLNEITTSSLNIYPNPVTDGSFEVALTLNSSIEQATIIITNLTGQVIYHQEALLNSGVLSQYVKFDEGISSGTYFLRVIAAESVYAAPFVYQR